LSWAKSKTLSQKITKAKMAGDVAQVTEDQPSKLNAVNLNASTAPSKSRRL
jgi:hypothetical protein